MYEIHITIAPPGTEEKLQTLRNIAELFKFRVSKFLMLQTAQKNVPDAFITGHADSPFVAASQVIRVTEHLIKQGFHVRRYKVEHVILDSRKEDSLKLL